MLNSHSGISRQPRQSIDKSLLDLNYIERMRNGGSTERNDTGIIVRIKDIAAWRQLGLKTGSETYIPSEKLWIVPTRIPRSRIREISELPFVDRLSMSRNFGPMEPVPNISSLRTKREDQEKIAKSSFNLSMSSITRSVEPEPASDTFSPKSILVKSGGFDKVPQKPVDPDGIKRRAYEIKEDQIDKAAIGLENSVKLGKRIHFNIRAESIREAVTSGKKYVLRRGSDYSLGDSEDMRLLFMESAQSAIQQKESITGEAESSLTLDVPSISASTDQVETAAGDFRLTLNSLNGQGAGSNIGKVRFGKHNQTNNYPQGNLEENASKLHGGRKREADSDKNQGNPEKAKRQKHEAQPITERAQ